MTNPLLSDIKDTIQPIPIMLPTQGLFYSEDILGEEVDPANLEVGTLSILDENTYNDPFLIVSGKGMGMMVSHLCPKIKQPGELVEVDIEAILIAARLASHGPNLKLTHTCQNPALKEDLEGIDPESSDAFVCREENNLDVDLQEFIMRYGPLKMMDRFVLELGVGQVVQLKPMSYNTSVQIMLKTFQTSKDVENFARDNEEEGVFDERLVQEYMSIFEQSTQTNVDALVDSIFYVMTREKQERVYDKELIAEWIKNLPLEDVRLIRDRINELNAELRKLSEITYTCPSCGHNNAVHVQLDPQKLFMQAEGSGTPTKSSASSKRTGKRGKPHSRISQR